MSLVTCTLFYPGLCGQVRYRRADDGRRHELCALSDVRPAVVDAFDGKGAPVRAARHQCHISPGTRFRVHIRLLGGHLPVYIPVRGSVSGSSRFVF